MRLMFEDEDGEWKWEPRHTRVIAASALFAELQKLAGRQYKGFEQICADDIHGHEEQPPIGLDNEWPCCTVWITPDEDDSCWVEFEAKRPGWFNVYVQDERWRERRDGRYDSSRRNLSYPPVRLDGAVAFVDQLLRAFKSTLLRGVG